MIKAISTVIASILMLMITIVLGGTTYLYISGIFTGRTATAFEIIDAINDTVIIRNSGTEPITSFSSASVDGNPAVYRVSAQDSSLVGYWKMDEASWVNDCTTKSVKDSSGTGNDGKACGAPSGPTPVSGRFGNSGSFDGSNDYVDVGTGTSISNLGSSFTVMGWLYYTTVAIDKAIFGAVSSDELRRLSLRSNGFEVQPNGVAMGDRAWAGISPVSANVWHHLVGTYDGTTARIYVDGVETATGTTSGTLDPNPVGNFIGANNPTGETWYMDGTIDEVKIYNRALTANEVKASYNIGTQINPGEMSTIKIYNPLTKGTHTARICTSSMCNTAILTIN